MGNAAAIRFAAVWTFGGSVFRDIHIFPVPQYLTKLHGYRYSEKPVIGSRTQAIKNHVVPRIRV